MTLPGPVRHCPGGETEDNISCRTPFCCTVEKQLQRLASCSVSLSRFSELQLAHSGKMISLSTCHVPGWFLLVKPDIPPRGSKKRMQQWKEDSEFQQTDSARGLGWTGKAWGWVLAQPLRNRRTTLRLVFQAATAGLGSVHLHRSW